MNRRDLFRKLVVAPAAVALGVPLAREALPRFEDRGFYGVGILDNEVLAAQLARNQGKSLASEQHSEHLTEHRDLVKNLYQIRCPEFVHKSLREQDRLLRQIAHGSS